MANMIYDIKRDMKDQTDFIVDLIIRLANDLSANYGKEPLWAGQPIANNSVMIEDCKRIRREVLKLQKLMKTDPRWAK